MSSRKTKLDLLVKVRYQNPLPAPPCPPKLLELPTDPRRYARAGFLDSFANDAPLPMVVDAELGMPLDLGQWEALWADGASDAALNPDASDRPALDPRDQLLMGDPSGSGGGGYTNGDHAPRAATRVHAPATPSSVTWLRKTEYLSRDTVALSRNPTADALVQQEHVDVSRGAQLASIASSFAHAHDGFALEELQHPTKRNVVAVDSYELLPDVGVWGNVYDLFRFADRPGERAADADDPRLESAVIRPMMENAGEPFLSYYLPPSDAAADAFRTARREGDMSLHVGEGEGESAFHFVRDYEPVKIEGEVNNEFLLVYDEGGRVAVPAPPNGAASEVRGKGAYYKGIERKMLLKKKRADPREVYSEKWSLVHILHDPPEPEDARTRDETMAEVLDPEWNPLADVDADGEADDEFPAVNGHDEQVEVAV